MKYTGIIYKYTSPSGKVYIGQTARPAARKAEHHYDSTHKCCTIFHKAVKKYSWENFNYEVLRSITCDTKEDLTRQLGELEQAAIKLYNSLAPNGYNQAVGGPGPLGHKVSDEVRKQMSNSHKGILHTEEEKRKIALANTGHTLSENTKAKIAKARSIPIVQLTLLGEFVQEFPSAKIAADTLGLIRANITACCRKKPRVISVGGYKWMYKKDYYEYNIRST